MSQEQKLIEIFVNKFSSNQPLERELKLIKTKYNKSPMLLYYVGFYYEKQGDLQSAKTYFHKCHKLCPNFPNPAFHLANYAKEGLADFEEIEPMLLYMIGKPTLDPTTGQTKYNITDQYVICSFLAPHYANNPKKYGKMISLFEGVLSKSTEQRHYSELEGYKNVCLALGAAYFDRLDERCMSYFIRGLTPHAYERLLVQNTMQEATLRSIDKMIYGRFVLAKDFFKAPYVLPVTPNSLYSNQAQIEKPRINDVNEKIRIGYLSPDFNKNAVGLFLTPLLKYFGQDKFEVYCYYTRIQDDAFTNLFKSYPVTWTNIALMSDQQAYELIHDTHQVYILVDLIACGQGNRLDLIAMRPAPVIVNYLGYPGCTHLTAHTHRIVDRMTDPVETESMSLCYDYTEKLVRLPRPFICYHMFENIQVPKIRCQLSLDDPMIYVGITNRSTKMSPEIMEAWRQIVTLCPQVKLVIKLDSGQKRNSRFVEFPEERLEYVPFMERLEDYLELHNKLDFCLDTFPYSGTTTTCSALFMGKPVFTVYDPAHNPHVSNVSGSLLLHLGAELCEPFVANSLADYVTRVVKYCQTPENIRRGRDDAHVEMRKKAFMQLTNPNAFMKDYESALGQMLA